MDNDHHDRSSLHFSDRSKLLMVANTNDLRSHSQHIRFSHPNVIGFPLLHPHDGVQYRVCSFFLTWAFIFGVSTLYNEIIARKDTHTSWFYRLFEP